MDLSQRVLTHKKIRLKNALDLTNPKVLNELGVSLKDITADSYELTQSIGDWAIKNGYDGMVVPSARNPTGLNVIGFKGL